jgi:hypothetical protein
MKVTPFLRLVGKNKVLLEEKNTQHTGYCLYLPFVFLLTAHVENSSVFLSSLIFSSLFLV